MDHADAETLYLITQRMDAQTGLRDSVLKFLAKAGVVVDEIRIDPEAAAVTLAQSNPEAVLAELAQRYPDKAMDAAINAYLRRGKDEKWIEARLEGKIKREKFVTALKEAVAEVLRQRDYATATDDIYLGLWKRTARQLKRELNLGKNDSLRDNQPRLALTYQGIAEEVCAAKLGERAELSWNEARAIVKHVARIIGAQADETSRLLGIDLATGRKLLATPD